MKGITIDEIDIKILNILQKDSSITNKELAKLIGLSEPPTLARVKKLIENKIILSYISVINADYY